jgi:hypothetical protein
MVWNKVKYGYFWLQKERIFHFYRKTQTFSWTTFQKSMIRKRWRDLSIVKIHSTAFSRMKATESLKDQVAKYNTNETNNFLAKES